MALMPSVALHPVRQTTHSGRPAALFSSRACARIQAPRVVQPAWSRAPRLLQVAGVLTPLCVSVRSGSSRTAGRGGLPSRVRRLAGATDTKPGPKVVFVIGGPGSGKGTQCERIATELGYVHLSAGDLLRAERQREGSKLGAEIEEVIRTGSVVRSEVIAQLLEQAMREAGWEQAKFVVDGYPRSIQQLSGWHEVLHNHVDLRCCISIDVTQEEMLKRLRGRAKTSGRLDDNEETIKKRFLTYEKETGPLLERFEADGLLRHVDGGRGIDEVWRDVMSLFVRRVGPGRSEEQQYAAEDLRSFLLQRS